MPNADIPEQARNQAKNRLKRLGITAKDFAKANKLSPSTVYAVLNGQKKCVRGESHRAAVLLGLKNGVVLS
ncbi:MULTISPECIES: DNA-binding protein [Pseudomonas]|uniref:DNA-binding protein n=1 Tax=Pseudomonas TaxID=286 RepID=UPI001238636A|nr:MULTISPECIES: DNA-binding protein [Pseudomonas]QEU31519.1 DNA-binding protein [Pseudomonas luteola]